MTILQNTFHGQHYKSSKSRDEITRILDRLAAGRADAGDRRWSRRVRSELCGVDGCTCARNEIGERTE